MVVRAESVEFGDLTGMVANPIMMSVHSTVHLHNPTQWNIAMNTVGLSSAANALSLLNILSPVLSLVVEG